MGQHVIVTIGLSSSNILYLHLLEDNLQGMRNMSIVYSLIYWNPCTMLSLLTLLTSRHTNDEKFLNRTSIPTELNVPYNTHYSS